MATVQNRKARKKRGAYTIRRLHVGGKFPYSTWLLEGTTRQGTRIRERNADRAELDGRKLVLEIRDANAPDERAHVSHLTSAQVREAEGAFQRLSGRSLTQAVDFFLTNYREPTTDLLLPQVQERFLAAKKTEIEPVTYGNYDRNIGAFVEQYPSLRPHEVTTQTVLDFLDTRMCPTTGRHAKWQVKDGKKLAASVGPRRWNHLRSDLHAFFEWCRLAPRKWVATNPVTDIPAKRVKHSLPRIVPAKKCVELMTHVVAYKNGILVPYCAFALFAGLRPAARSGEIWKFANHPDRDRLIKREDGVIQIPPDVSKVKRQRLVTIQPNLARWLDAYPLSKYPLYPAGLEGMMAEVRKKFGLGSDVLRHTFASMFVGKFRSIGDCAIQSGNSESIVKGNYLRELVMPLLALKSVLEEYLLAIDQATERLMRHEELIAAQAPQWRMYPAVLALRCFRGFELVAATMLVAELCDVQRFAHPRGLMAYLGLVPTEHSTGTTRRLGAITKAGNAQARWILIEAVQHASLPPKVSAQLSQRQEGQPELYRRISWKMQNRLYRRHWHLTNRGVMAAKAKVALARELCGFVWDLLRQVPPPKPAPTTVATRPVADRSVSSSPPLAPVSRSATRRPHVRSSAHVLAR